LPSFGFEIKTVILESPLICHGQNTYNFLPCVGNLVICFDKPFALIDWRYKIDLEVEVSKLKS